MSDSVNIATKTWKAIGMDTLDTNVNNMFSISNRRIVIPVNGLLIATARCSFVNNTTGDRGISFEVNGSMVNSTSVVNRACETTQTHLCTQIITHVSAGDTITMHAYQTSGSSLGLESAWIRCALIKD